MPSSDRNARCHRGMHRPRGLLIAALIGVASSASSASAQLQLCPADITPPGGNGVVNIDDLIALLSAFGSCPITGLCPADLTPPGGNGVVNIDDLIALLGAFGPCPIDLSIGPMLFQSAGSYLLNLPPNFFGPGSDPFNGNVFLMGVPLETRGAYELGTTDTVIERLDQVILDPPPSSVDIPIELVELHLQSAKPIIVTVLGAPQLWQLDFTIGPETGGGISTLSLTRTHDNGGTFTATLQFSPQLAFTRLDGPGNVVTNAPPTTISTAEADAWVRDEQCLGFGMQISDNGDCIFVAGINFGGPTLNLGAITAVAAPFPPPIIDPAANVDPTVASIARNAVISAGANIGPGVTIGPNAFIGPGATIMAGALIGEFAQIGALATVGPNSVVGGFSQLADNGNVGADCQIGRNCFMDVFTAMGDGSRLGGGSVIGLNTQIGLGFDGERSLIIGANVLIPDGVFLALGAIIPDGAIQSESMFRCMLNDGSMFIGTSADCSLANGSVWGNTPLPENFNNRLVVGSAATPGDNGALPAELVDLATDIDNANIHKKAPGQAYVDDTHDCEDFADELEQALTALGYEATVTLYWCYAPNPDHHWYNWLWTSGTIITKGHAIVDIHADDGSIHWVEPQLSSAQGALTHANTDLDFDGDGSVEYATGRGSGTTDGDYRIEVWDSLQDAIDAGHVLD